MAPRADLLARQDAGVHDEDAADEKEGESALEVVEMSLHGETPTMTRISMRSCSFTLRRVRTPDDMRARGSSRPSPGDRNIGPFESV